MTLYEPEELVLSAMAGTPLAEIEQLLADHNQMLAFEPMDYGPLFGAARGRGTLGGVLAANVSGPRRIKAGAARDHVLGIKAVSGRGEKFKSGGRVVKNVTGYDLSKGLAGSWGTLAVVTEATFKVLPRPEAEATLVVAGLDDLIAVTALCKAMGTPLDVARGGASARRCRRGDSRRVVRDRRPFGDAHPPGGLRAVGGFPRAEADRGDRPARAGLGAARRTPRAATWRAVRDVVGLRREPAPGLARQRCAERRPDGRSSAQGNPRAALFLRLVGRPDLDRGDRRRERTASRAKSARRSRRPAAATRRWCAAARRCVHAVPPFEPQPEALAALSGRLKAQFDPRGILNPGRMHA